MQVKWLAKALANLTDEADYIAKESPANAKAFFTRVIASVEQLAPRPGLTSF
jgi:toxin ParE1/3/4